MCRSSRRGAFAAGVAAAWLAYVLAVFSADVRAEDESLPVKTKVLDLVYRVQDLGGKVQDLQVEETETEVKIELPGDVLFDFDKADIRADAEPVLQKVAEIIKKYRSPIVRVEGHTDAKGSDSYNQRLSERRAESVKSWLEKKGSIGGVLTTKGWGSEKPVAPNQKPDGSDDPDGRQKNRRVEITIKKS